MTSDVVASDLGSEPPLHSPADDMSGDRVPEVRPQGWALAPVTGCQSVAPDHERCRTRG
jgi:hypothetical protein